MHIFCQTFALPKEGREYTDYEDACFPCSENDIRMHTQEESNTALFRAAVTDGATDSCFSQYWAQLLAHGFGTGDLEQEVSPASLEKYQRAWKEYLSRQELPWYAEEKAEMGAFAALVGLSLFSEKQRWKALAIGDCCVVQTRGSTMLRAFPMEKSDDFSRFPMLVGSMAERNTKVFEQRRELQDGHWEPGDVFFLMSDALACWFLKNVEDGDGELAIKLLCRIDAHESFVQLMQHERNQTSHDGSPRMLNDDSTLVRVAVSNQRMMKGGSSAIMDKDEFLATLRQLNSKSPKRKTATVEMPMPSQSSRKAQREVESGAIGGVSTRGGAGSAYGVDTDSGTTNGSNTKGGSSTGNGSNRVQAGSGSTSGTGSGGRGSGASAHAGPGVAHQSGRGHDGIAPTGGKKAKMLVILAAVLLVMLSIGAAALMFLKKGAETEGQAPPQAAPVQIEPEPIPREERRGSSGAAHSSASAKKTSPKKKGPAQKDPKAGTVAPPIDGKQHPISEPPTVDLGRPEPEPLPQVPSIPEPVKPTQPSSSFGGLWDRLSGKRKGSSPGSTSGSATPPGSELFPDNPARIRRRANPPLENLLPKDISGQLPPSTRRQRRKGGDSQLLPPAEGGGKKDGEVDPILPDIKPHEGDKVRKFRGG